MAKITKAVQFTFRFAVASFIYFIMLLLPSNNVFMQEIWPVLPFYALVSLGCYAFITIGMDLLIIKDCPDAYNELVKDIQSCKEELKKHNL